MKKLVFLSIFLFVFLTVAGFFGRAQIRDFIFTSEKNDLPKAQSYNEFETSTHDAYLEAEEELSTTSTIAGISEDPDEDPYIETQTKGEDIGEGKNEEEGGDQALLPVERDEALPTSINLAVPFTPQAPHANWDLPYQEACEEASLLMVVRYKKDELIASAEDADQEILKLVEFQNTFLGDYKDTTAEETAEIARTYYGFDDTEVLYDPTIEDIKRELAEGNPVIVPAAGRQLPNPHFHSPGPLYHMLVIRGYTQDLFITNDPGTKRGEEFTYEYRDLLNAMHDWNGGDVEGGRKVMIVVK